MMMVVMLCGNSVTAFAEEDEPQEADRKDFDGAKVQKAMQN